jgi:hypothetical protein
MSPFISPDLNHFLNGTAIEATRIAVRLCGLLLLLLHDVWYFFFTTYKRVSHNRETLGPYILGPGVDQTVNPFP